MKKISLKQNKALTMTDVVIAIIILCLFTGVVGNLYYQIVLHSNMMRFDSVAIYHVVQIAEKIDKISYEEVTNELNNSLKEEFSIPDLYTITIDVQNYNEDDNTKEDVIKIITIKVEYEFMEENKKIEIKKLKIKEI